MKNILKSNRNYTPKQTIITLKHTADGSNVLMKLKKCYKLFVNIFRQHLNQINLFHKLLIVNKKT
jgi:hypothetical protein